MYRSWGYILMFVATLAGVVALLWPSPPVRTIEEIAMPARPAPTRAEAPAKAPKQAQKPAPKPPRAETPKPSAPAVVSRMPQQNTTTRRGAAVPQNGMQPPEFGKPVGSDRGAPPAAPAARPPVPPRPNAETPPRDAGAR